MLKTYLYSTNVGGFFCFVLLLGWLWVFCFCGFFGRWRGFGWGFSVVLVLVGIFRVCVSGFLPVLVLASWFGLGFFVVLLLLLVAF